MRHSARFASLLLLSYSSSATAQSTEPAVNDAGSTPSTNGAEQVNGPAQPQTSKPTDEETRVLYKQGKEAYAEGDYEKSLELIGEVYKRTGHPALLFNMAQAHRLAGPEHCGDAYRLYKEYLVQDAEAPNGAEVREYIKELEPCATAAQQETTPPPTTKQDAATAPATPETKPHPTALPLSIAGGVILLTGIGLFIAAKLRYAQAKQDCPCEEGSLSTWETLEKVSIGTMAVGGATLATGGVIWWASVNPSPEEQGVWFGVRGTF